MLWLVINDKAYYATQYTLIFVQNNQSYDVMPTSLMTDWNSFVGLILFHNIINRQHQAANDGCYEGWHETMKA